MVHWSFYIVFVVFVLGLVGLDLGVFRKNDREVSAKSALWWSLIWISLSLLFGLLIFEYAGHKLALEFLTGYLVEKSLSIDNIFIFIVIFKYFKVPKNLQHRVLYLGVLGALIFRTIFIAIGSVLMQFHSVIIILGIFLVLTGIRMFFSSNTDIHPEDNFILALLQKAIPIKSGFANGKKLFVRENGRMYGTSLLVTLVFIEFTDIMFATDSIPAVFAVTKETFIVFTSNIFAILGLRSLYFLLANVMDRFYLIKYGLACVLVFVGLKMAYLNERFGGEFPIGWSFAIIAFFIVGSILLSVLLKVRSQNGKS
jgi:tellurite resistance protein TerC